MAFVDARIEMHHIAERHHLTAFALWRSVTQHVAPNRPPCSSLHPSSYKTCMPPACHLHTPWGAVRWKLELELSGHPASPIQRHGFPTWGFSFPDKLSQVDTVTSKPAPTDPETWLSVRLKERATCMGWASALGFTSCGTVRSSRDGWHLRRSRAWLIQTMSLSRRRFLRSLSPRRPMSTAWSQSKLISCCYSCLVLIWCWCRCTSGDYCQLVIPTG